MHVNALNLFYGILVIFNQYAVVKLILGSEIDINISVRENMLDYYQQKRLLLLKFFNQHFIY